MSTGSQQEASVFTTIDDIIKDSNWHSIIFQSLTYLALTNICPRNHYRIPFNKSIYIPFCKNEVPIVIESVGYKQWWERSLR